MFDRFVHCSPSKGVPEAVASRGSSGLRRLKAGMGRGRSPRPDQRSWCFNNHVKWGAYHYFSSRELPTRLGESPSTRWLGAELLDRHRMYRSRGFGEPAEELCLARHVIKYHTGIVGYGKPQAAKSEEFDIGLNTDGPIKSAEALQTYFSGINLEEFEIFRGQIVLLTSSNMDHVLWGHIGVLEFAATNETAPAAARGPCRRWGSTGPPHAGPSTGPTAGSSWPRSRRARRAESGLCQSRTCSFRI